MEDLVIEKFAARLESRSFMVGGLPDEQVEALRFKPITSGVS